MPSSDRVLPFKVFALYSPPLGWLEKVRLSGSAFGVACSSCSTSFEASSLGRSSKRKLPSLDRTRTIITAEESKKNASTVLLEVEEKGAVVYRSITTEPDFRRSCRLARNYIVAYSCCSRLTAKSCQFAAGGRMEEKFVAISNVRHIFSPVTCTQPHHVTENIYFVTPGALNQWPDSTSYMTANRESARFNNRVVGRWHVTRQATCS